MPARDRLLYIEANDPLYVYNHLILVLQALASEPRVC